MTQSLLAILLVAAAVLYLGLRAWRSALNARRERTEPGCGAGCGCGDRISRRE